MGRLAGWLAEGQVDPPLDHRLGQRRLAWRPALVPQQPVHALGREPFLPPPHRHLGAAHLAHDRKRAQAVGDQQHDPRPVDMLSAAVPIRHDRLEPSTIVGGNLELDPCAHAGIVAEPDVQRDSYDCISALEMAAQSEREVAAFGPPIQPQRMKEALRKRAYQEARSIADTVVNRLELKHGGRDLLRLFQGRGDTNIGILITLALGYQNKRMGGGKRDEASVAQLEEALAGTPDIADALTAAVRMRLKPGNEADKITTQESRG